MKNMIKRLKTEYLIEEGGYIFTYERTKNYKLFFKYIKNKKIQIYADDGCELFEYIGADTSFLHNNRFLTRLFKNHKNILRAKKLNRICHD